MEDKVESLQTLREIRDMMQRSNKFLSLSGLSGIFVGLYALAGAVAGKILLDAYINQGVYLDQDDENAYGTLIVRCLAICFLVLAASVLTAFAFSARKARKSGQKIFDSTAQRLLINMLIPLLTGGVFCVALLFQGGSSVLFIGPAMLLFYGLALINGSKYTLNDIRYLGCLEIILGMAACFFPLYSLYFWAFGFGILHIVYGTIMWFKYDRIQH